MGRNVSQPQASTKAIYSAFSTAGYTAVAVANCFNGKASLSPALTANTLVDLINESGSAGEISQLSFFTMDATSRTLRVVITVDGGSIYDITSAAIAGANLGCALAGQLSSTNSATLPPIKYASSIRVQYASSVSETGKFTTCLARNQVQ